MAITSSRLTMQMNDYRGLSAYEIAVKNGFEGTETEWLESLKGEKGADGDFITVNHKKAVDGNVSVNGTDIYLYPGMQDKTVTQELESLSESASESASELNVSISAVETVANSKAQVLTQTASLPKTTWTQSGEIYTQNAAVTGVTIDGNKTSVIVTPPTNREMEEAYMDCAVRASAQGAGTVTFTCVDLPDIDLEANVMVVILGTEAASTESEASEE